MDIQSNASKATSSGGSTDPAKLKQIRASWRPKCGPFAAAPGTRAAGIDEARLDFSPAPATAGLDERGGYQGAGFEAIDFSRVPKKDLARIERLSKLRFAGQHPGRIGYGIGPQIDRIQQKSSGAGGLDPELSPLTQGSPTAWLPMTGPLAPG